MRVPFAFNAEKSGLLLVILVLGVVLTCLAGTHVDRVTGAKVNSFLNLDNLLDISVKTGPFAIMAIGMTLVIIAGGIDLSVGSIYALAGVLAAMVLRAMGPASTGSTLAVGLVLMLGVGALCGLVNGLLIVGLRVPPFIITLGTMWIFRGIAFVASNAESIPMPDVLMTATKATLGLGASRYPVPLLVMLVVTVIGVVFLTRTVAGRHIFAVGGNADASRFAGLKIPRLLVGVYTLAGLTAGLAAYMGNTFYGSACCNDANGYELYVIASAVVGGASLTGGKGSAFQAILGALLIVLIRQSITTLRLSQNYEWMIIGCAIIVAVCLDQLNARLAARRLAQQAIRRGKESA